MTDSALIERITRSLAFMLRHKPDRFDLEVDAHGFADFEEVIRALNERLGEPVEGDEVVDAVESGDRQRYEIVAGKIRALYGHSIPVEPGPDTQPPEFLYVCVPTRDLSRMRRFGLRGGRRSYLHLALSPDDACESGRRMAAEYTLVKVHALDAWEDGVNFYDRKALFLADELPTEMLEVLESFDDGEDPAPRGERPERGDRRRRRGPRRRERDEEQDEELDDEQDVDASRAEVDRDSEADEDDGERRPRRRRRGRRGGREGGEERREDLAASRRVEGDGDEDRGARGHRDRDRGEARDRDRGEARDRDRGEARDRDRGEARDRDRGGDRSRDRGGDRDRDRDRDRGRPRGRGEDRREAPARQDRPAPAAAAKPAAPTTDFGLGVFEPEAKPAAPARPAAVAPKPEPAPVVEERPAPTPEVDDGGGFGAGL
jgi:putative RNA 2'-phosphotransferase